MPKILTYPELRAKSVPYTADHLRRLVAAGEFPAPVPISPHRIGWVESEIDAWIENLIAKRDAMLAAKPKQVAGYDGSTAGVSKPQAKHLEGHQPAAAAHRVAEKSKP